METRNMAKIYVGLLKFKSYYVVWKPLPASLLFDSTRQFKSYYVVWKLFFPIICAASCLRFKSYYVVWKPYQRMKLQQQMTGLNRTMQYGNKKNSVDEKEIIESLNRTMQYGNPHIHFQQEVVLVSLNRTMQYGNFRIRITTHFSKIRFKSYYVVWKLKGKAYTMSQRLSV